MGDNPLSQRGKSLEEEYFHRKEKELIEKLRQKSAREGQLKELSEATGIPNEEILQTLQELGYTRETVALLHLVPLIHIGWADGKISKQEREMILEAANMRGVTEDSPAYKQLKDWLDNRPGEEFFEQTLRVIADLLQTSPESSGAGDLLTQSMQVASASGGILGLGNRISDEEQALLERIAAALGKETGSIRE